MSQKYITNYSWINDIRLFKPIPFSTASMNTQIVDAAKRYIGPSKESLEAKTYAQFKEMISDENTIKSTTTCLYTLYANDTTRQHIAQKETTPEKINVLMEAFAVTYYPYEIAPDYFDPAAANYKQTAVALVNEFEFMLGVLRNGNGFSFQHFWKTLTEHTNTLDDWGKHDKEELPRLIERQLITIDRAIHSGQAQDLGALHTKFDILRMSLASMPNGVARLTRIDNFIREEHAIFHGP